jgi:site-specific recombinase XerD
MADMLFVSYSGAADCKRVDGKPLLARRVQRQLKRYAAAVGITAAISPHWGRCSAICRLLEQRCNYADIQAVTRHKSIATLEIYDRRRREIDDSVGNALQYGKVG